MPDSVACHPLIAEAWAKGIYVFLFHFIFFGWHLVFK